MKLCNKNVINNHYIDVISITLVNTMDDILEETQVSNKPIHNEQSLTLCNECQNKQSTTLEYQGKALNNGDEVILWSRDPVSGKISVAQHCTSCGKRLPKSHL